MSQPALAEASGLHRTGRILPVAALALFAPLMAEFVLGDQYLSGTVDAGQQVGEFVLFVLWYGMAAVLIREVTRRTGRGWPTILLLATGFALIEEGLLTQSLFNPHYLGLDLISYGYLGFLGTALPWAIFVLSIPCGLEHRDPDRADRGDLPGHRHGARARAVPRSAPGARRSPDAVAGSGSGWARRRACWPSAARGRTPSAGR